MRSISLIYFHARENDILNDLILCNNPFDDRRAIVQLTIIQLGQLMRAAELDHSTKGTTQCHSKSVRRLIAVRVVVPGRIGILMVGRMMPISLNARSLALRHSLRNSLYSLRYVCEMARLRFAIPHRHIWRCWFGIIFLREAGVFIFAYNYWPSSAELSASLISMLYCVRKLDGRNLRRRHRIKVSSNSNPNQ